MRASARSEENGRRSQPDYGTCGLGGNICFCHTIGLSAVSSYGPRIPVKEAQRRPPTQSSENREKGDFGVFHMGVIEMEELGMDLETGERHIEHLVLRIRDHKHYTQ